jgi:hypothetical protein
MGNGGDGMKNFASVVTSWTDREEAIFADIQRVSRLNRIEAIQLWKRCSRDAAEAIILARKNYPAVTDAQRTRAARMREARHATRMGHFQDGIVRTATIAGA